MGLEVMRIESNIRKKGNLEPNLKGFGKDIALIQKYLTPEEATDLVWHARIANEVASRTVNVRFPKSIHPNVHLFSVIKNLGNEAKGYAVPTDELVPRVISKLAFPNINIDPPDGVDKHVFKAKATEIIDTAKRFYYLQALRAVLKKTGKQSVFDGMGTQLELSETDLNTLIQETENAIQTKFNALASISSGLTPVKIVNDDEFTRKALKQIGGLPKLQKVEGTRTKTHVFQFSNSGLEDVRSAIITRHQRNRNIKIGVGVAVPAGAVAICAIGNLRPPEITPAPRATTTSEEENGNNYPQVEAASTENGQLLLDYCNTAYANYCTENGITLENTKGAYFGDGNFLFNLVDNQSRNYFWYITGYSEIQPLDFGIDIEGNFYLGPKLNTYGSIKPRPDQILKYFTWNPNQTDKNGGIIIIYQPSGTPTDARYFILPKESNIHGVIKNASLIPIQTPESSIITEIKSKLEENETFTLNADGQIEMQTPEGIVILPGITISPDGKMTVTHDNQTFEADPQTIEIEGQTLSFKSLDGKTWVWDGESLKQTLLSKEMLDSAKNFFGEGFGITPDGKVIDKNLGTEIQGFTIVPFNEQTMIPPYGKEVTWGWQRVYEFEGNPDFTVVGTEADITITEDGGLDMYAWEYKDGEFARQKVEFAAPNNGTVELEGFSPHEVQYMIINNSSDDPKYKVNSFQARRSLGFNIQSEVVNRTIYITHKGMWESIDDYYNWYGNNFIPVLDTNGNWSKVETTEFMVFPEFKDRGKALVVWMGKDNKPIVVVMEGKYLEMPEYFNPYWKNHDIEDPFTP